MEITNSIINQHIPANQLSDVNNLSKTESSEKASSENLPSIHSIGASLINSNLPISYTKIGEIEIPGLKDKASIFKLANGQRVIIAPKQGPTVVKTAYNVGSINETDDIRGISHFIEHSLFNGSKDLAPREYDEQVSVLGGTTNANTSYATTNYFLSLQLLNDNSLEEAIRLNALQTQFPTFPEEQIQKEKEPVKSEIDMYKDMPFDVTHSQVIKDLFNIDTKSTNAIIGTKENINALTREKLLDYYNTWYTPDNAVTVITGDVNVDETMALVSKYYNKPNNYANVNKRYSEPIKYNDSPKRKDIIQPNASSAHISMGFAIPEGTTKYDADKLEVLTELISSPTSRLSKAFDKIGASFCFQDEKIQNKPDGARAKTIEADTKEEDIESVLQTIYKELTYIANNPPSYDELENMKKQMITSINSSSQSSIVLNNILSDTALENNYNYWNGKIANIQRMTPEEISDTARRFLDLNKTAICVSHEKTATPQSIQNNYNSTDNYSRNVSFGASINLEKLIEEQCSKVKEYRLNNNIETTIIPGNPYARPVFEIDFKPDNLNSVPQAALEILQRLLNRGSMIKNNDECNSFKSEKNIDIGFYAGFDGITVSGICNDENLQDTMTLIKETLSYPNFSQEEFDKIKQLVKDQITNEDISSYDKLFEHIFPSVRSYASKEQKLKELDALTLNDIRNLYSYIMSNSKVHAALTADIEQKPYLQDIFHNELSTVTGSFKPYSQDKSPSYNIYQPNTKAEILTQSDERLQADIATAYTYPKTENIDDNAKILVLNAVLGGNMSSRLFKDLREEQKLAYHVGSSIMSVKDTGLILLDIRTTTQSADGKEGSPENVTKALEGFNKNVNLLKTENISEEELQKVKTFCKSSILNGLEINSDRLFCFAGNKDSAYTKNYFYELFKAIDRLTPDDIRAAACYVFKNPPVTSVVASQKTLDALGL